ncbi:hypothetical protein ACOSQ3_018687 [Xanthoceras sorbifolium]
MPQMTKRMKILSSWRHFDTASLYGSEKSLGDAITEALRLGLITSREDLFITSNFLWASFGHYNPHLVIPALQKSLRTLQIAYLDLYLVHWPISAKPVEKYVYPIPKEELLPGPDYYHWTSRLCGKHGRVSETWSHLSPSVSATSLCKKLKTILSLATIPPSVNQVEINPIWQQRKLVELCKAKGIIITAFSPLGAKGTSWGTNQVTDNEALKHIAKAHGKTVVQVSLRWIIEQGATAVVKSFNRKRMKENLEIFDWALTDEDYEKINQIPQHRLFNDDFVFPHGAFKNVEELWDDEY